MGDLLYEAQGRRKKDIFSAAEMYTKAALSDEPQVCFLWLIFRPVCIVYMLDNLHFSSTGMAQPWPPRWRGFQAATVSIGWTQPFRAVSGRQQFASKNFIQKVCLIFFCLYTVHELPTCRTLFPPSLPFSTDAGTQKKQIPIYLAASPSSVCIFSPFKRNIVAPLRSVWY